MTTTRNNRTLCLLSIILASGAAVTAGTRHVVAQAYTYEEPTCEGVYQDEAAKPQQLRVVWEMSAGQKCLEVSNVQVACRHFQAALTASGQMPAEAGDGSDIKTFLKTMIKTNGC